MISDRFTDDWSPIRVGALIWAAVLLLLGTSIGWVAIDPPQQQLEAVAQPRLQERQLAADIYNGIDIDYSSGTGNDKWKSSEWLNEGFDGVRIVGEGPGRTIIHGAKADWSLLVADRRAGIVELRDLTIRTGGGSGKRKAIHFGFSDLFKPLNPNFKLILVNVHVEAPEPTPADIAAGREHTAVWGVFTYNADLELRDCVLNLRRVSEHAIYTHGFANRGAFILRTHFNGAGSQLFKSRPAKNETLWPGEQALINISRCVFEDWGQPWEWRGACAIVLENAGTHVWIHDSIFRPGKANGKFTSGARGYAIGVTSEPRGYGWPTGAADEGYGHGYIVIERVYMEGQDDGKLSKLIGFTKGSSTNKLVAKAGIVKNSGLWGENYTLVTGGFETGAFSVVDCNTEEVRSMSKALGFTTVHEAMIPTTHRLVPISEGYEQ